MSVWDVRNGNANSSITSKDSLENALNGIAGNENGCPQRPREQIHIPHRKQHTKHPLRPTEGPCRILLTSHLLLQSQLPLCRRGKSRFMSITIRCPQHLRPTECCPLILRQPQPGDHALPRPLLRLHIPQVHQQLRLPARCQGSPIRIPIHPKLF